MHISGAPRHRTMVTSQHFNKSDAITVRKTQNVFILDFLPVCMRTDLCRWLVLVSPVLLGVFWQDLMSKKNMIHCAKVFFLRNLNDLKKCCVTFLNFFLMSAYVSSLSCRPVFGLYTRKSLFLVFTSLTRIAVFLLFLIWKWNVYFTLMAPQIFLYPSPRQKERHRKQLSVALEKLCQVKGGWRRPFARRPNVITAGKTAFR